MSILYRIMIIYICSLPEMDVNNYSLRTQKALSMEIVPSVFLVYFVNKKNQHRHKLIINLTIKLNV